MRGLTDSGDGGAGDSPAHDGDRGGTTARSTRLRAGMAASGTALAGLAAIVVFCVGCSTGGTGTRDEGPAGTQPVAQVTTPPAATPSGTAKPARRVDAVALLRGDAKVSERVKDGLKPCAGDAYPVDTSYGSMTDGPVTDVVINVMACSDSVGVGTYVYRQRDDGSYQNVFTAETPAVYGTIDRGDLVVTTQVYGSKDPLAYPSGSEVVTYRWASDRFNEHDRVHNDFNRAVGSTEGTFSEPVPEPTKS
ncbi:MULTISPECIES: hypothetical protein [unclassified Streptomyces]|uniref:hypothetical protein n=1 Tax=unclassified Streptomyces TaxID=2593676 RepID=UPI002DDC56BC|nr:hypothetical protein [Streptomyces sp. NBC_01237]WRZ73228.1 hypothetical protein OG251_17205 [Streptomyces sp. NBC_01237]